MKLVPLERGMLPALYELYRKVEIYDQIPIVTPWEEIAEMADDPHLDLPNDGRLALVGEKVVGFCQVLRRPGESDHARAFLVGGVEGRSFVLHRASRSAVSDGRSMCSSSQRLRNARSARRSSTSNVPTFTPSRDAHTSRGWSSRKRSAMASR